MTEYFIHWIDIANEKMIITIDKISVDFINETIDFSKTSSGRLCVFIVNYGICDNDFNDAYNGMIDDFRKRNVDQHNYIILQNFRPYELIPLIEEQRKNLEESDEDKKKIYVEISQLKELNT